jgi:hypothetical protein
MVRRGNSDGDIQITALKEFVAGVAKRFRIAELRRGKSKPSGTAFIAMEALPNSCLSTSGPTLTAVCETGLAALNHQSNALCRWKTASVFRNRSWQG